MKLSGMFQSFFIGPTRPLFLYFCLFYMADQQGCPATSGAFSTPAANSKPSIENRHTHAHTQSPLLYRLIFADVGIRTADLWCQKRPTVSQPLPCMFQRFPQFLSFKVLVKNVGKLDGETTFQCWYPGNAILTEYLLSSRLFWAVVVAQWQSTPLVIWRSWVQNPPGAGLFLLRLLLSNFCDFPTPVECPYSGPTEKCISICVL